MSRSVVSQILSGLAYSWLGLFLLGILLSFGGTHCFPPGLMPPAKGLHLQYVQWALNSYAMDHDGRYPERIDAIADDSMLKGGRKDVIHTPEFTYFAPKFSADDPYNQKNGGDILLTYETDKWYFSVNIAGHMHYYRKKISSEAAGSRSRL